MITVVKLFFKKGLGYSFTVSLKENNWFFVTDQTPRPAETYFIPYKMKIA
jgi:hypothetical protein